MRPRTFRYGYVLGLILLLVAGTTDASTKGGLILSGVDTIDTRTERGFDFVYQVACTTISQEPDCYNHMRFYKSSRDAAHFQLAVSGVGRAVHYGKIDLDNITEAPSDSVFNERPLSVIENIPVDSLDSRVGNVYVLRTDRDPRYERDFYAKIKITGYEAVDAENNEVQFQFLWAMQFDGTKDLTTTDLDSLDPTQTRHTAALLAGKGAGVISRGRVFVDVNGGRAGHAGIGSGAFVRRYQRPGGVFDVRGRAVHLGVTSQD